MVFNGIKLAVEGSDDLDLLSIWKRSHLYCTSILSLVKHVNPYHYPPVVGKVGHRVRLCAQLKEREKQEVRFKKQMLVP